MANIKLGLGLLNDVMDFYERLESKIIISEAHRNEIKENVGAAVSLTEKLFGDRANGSRVIEKNDSVGDAWHKAAMSIEKHLPEEQLATSLLKKGDAWLNIHKWTEQDLENENIKIEEIRERVKKVVAVKRKYFRPKE